MCSLILYLSLSVQLTSIGIFVPFIFILSFLLSSIVVLQCCFPCGSFLRISFYGIFFFSFVRGFICCLVTTCIPTQCNSDGHWTQHIQKRKEKNKPSRQICVSLVCAVWLSLAHMIFGLSCDFVVRSLSV